MRSRRRKSGPTDYQLERWAQYGNDYRDEALRFGELNGFAVESDPLRYPFVLRGNVGNGERKVVLAAIAPYANPRVPVPEFESVEQWRDAHRRWDGLRSLHQYGVRIGQASIGEDMDVEEWASARYVAVDMVPYHVLPGQLKRIRWRNSSVFDLVKHHCNGWAEIIGGEDLDLLLFTGKPWVEALVSNVEDRRLFPFEPRADFRLGEVTGKAHHNAVVYVGRVQLTDRWVPAAVVGHLLSTIRGLAYDAAVALGARIGKDLGRAPARG